MTSNVIAASIFEFLNTTINLFGESYKGIIVWTNYLSNKDGHVKLKNTD